MTCPHSSARGRRRIDALCCPRDLLDLRVAAEVMPPPPQIPTSQGPAIPYLPDDTPVILGLRTGLVCACEGEKKKKIPEGGEQVIRYASARQRPCTLALGGRRERAELGWAALSCLSEKVTPSLSALHFRPTSLWSPRGETETWKEEGRKRSSWPRKGAPGREDFYLQAGRKVTGNENFNSCYRL